MADERKEPTLSSTPLGEPAKRPAPAARPAAGQSRPQRPANAPQRPVAAGRQQHRPVVATEARASGPMKFMLALALLLGLAALLTVLFGVQQLLSARAAMEQQQSRIVELENKLALAGDSSSQSITSLAANLVTLGNDVKLSLSEVDKLWATRNVNKKAISDNDGKISDLDARIDQSGKVLDERLQGVNKQLGNQGEATRQLISQLRQTVQNKAREDEVVLNSLDEELNRQIEQLTLMRNELESLREEAKSREALAKSLGQQQQEQELLIQSLRERLQQQNGDRAAAGAQTSQQLSAARSKLDSVSQQVEKNRQTLASFDAFRRAVNRDLLLLKQGGGQ